MKKDVLRREIKAERRAFAEEERKRADVKICENFLKAFSGFKTYFIYNAYNGEADTSAIITAISNAGKQVYLPRVEGENIVPAPFGKTQTGTYGIQEPMGQAFLGEIDITVIPLLAVNKSGYRIGYGKGFYDRFLKNKKTLRVGLGYFFQLREFEQDLWDEPLDAFVSEKGIIFFDK